VEWVEVTAKTVAEAKDKTLDYLGVDETQAEFEVVEEPRVGLFRRVKGEARVRARIKPSSPRPKAERRDRKRRSRDGSRESGRAEAKDDQGSRRSGESRDNRSDRGGRGGSERRRDGDGETRRPARSAAATDRTDERSVPRSDEQPRGRSTTPPPQAAPAPVERTKREEALSEMNEDEQVSGVADDGRQTEYAVEFVSGLVGAFGLTATVTSATVDEHYDEVRVSGSDLGILIGPRAGALDAVQELTRVVAQRRSGGRGESRLRVDIGGYRQRRREALERFVIKIADEVRATGTVKALEPMNSADRKVVHDVVGTLEGVATRSEGEDPRRRVVIVPGS